MALSVVPSVRESAGGSGDEVGHAVAGGVLVTKTRGIEIDLPSGESACGQFRLPLTAIGTGSGPTG